MNNIIDNLKKYDYSKWDKIRPKDISLGLILEILNIDVFYKKGNFYSNEFIRVEYKCNFCSKYFPIFWNKKSNKFIVKPCSCVSGKKPIDKYQSYFGIDAGTKLLNEYNINRTKKFTNTYRYWEDIGIPNKDIKNKISTEQKDRSKKNLLRLGGLPKDSRTCRQYGYWINKGYTEEEAKSKVKQIQNNNGYEYYKDKYGEIDGEIIQKSRNTRWLNTLYQNNDMVEVNKTKSFTNNDYIEKYGKEKFYIKEKNRVEKILKTKYDNNIFSKNCEEKCEYLKKVSYCTRISKKYYMKIINPDNLIISHKENHIDHIYSVSEVYKNNIPPNIIGSPVNLRLINWYDNLKKSSRCDIDIYELLSLYYQFIYEDEDNEYKKLIGIRYEN